jgi:uncharacterized membrane protein
MNESALTAYILPLLIGVVAGLRAMTAPAAVSIGAYVGQLSLAGTPLAFLSTVWAASILGLFALVEFVTDQLPSTPSRKVPVQFGARLLTGGLSGAAIGASGGHLVMGLVAGIIGAVIGTYGGAEFRSRLAATFRSDPPAAFIEDAVAVVTAVFIVVAAS